MSMAMSETDRIIAILEEAKRRSDEGQVDAQYSDRIDFALIRDLLEEGLVRGLIRPQTIGVSESFRLDGISLLGREYLSRLRMEKRMNSLPSKAMFWGMAVFTFLLGSVIAPISVELLKKYLRLGS